MTERNCLGLTHEILEVLQLASSARAEYAPKLRNFRFASLDDRIGCTALTNNRAWVKFLD